MVKTIYLYIALGFVVISTQKANSQTLELDNGILSVQFKNIHDNGANKVVPDIFNYEKGIKKQVPINALEEAYFLFDVTNLELTQDVYYSYWLEKGKERIDENKIWSAFSTPGALQCFPTRALKKGNKIILEFDGIDFGDLTVEWELPEGASHFNVNMNFTPKTANNYSLGYRLFVAEDHENINELLMPMMWQQKRFPDKPYTLFDPQLPTPVSMVNITQNDMQFNYGIAASLDKMPYEWPSLLNRHFGMQIRDDLGRVHPAICGPVGLADQNQQNISLDFKITIDNSNCIKSFQNVCQKIYGLHDYRENTKVNLTDAILNMIDLVKDDQHSGWWPRAKGFYQIESKNGATQAVPMVMMSLFHLTADEELYKKRVVPSIEFTLSRSGSHFSPMPDNTGGYGKGGMKGPIDYFGSSFYKGCYEMTKGYMPYFNDQAFGNNRIKPTKGVSHSAEFAEWIARYLVQGEKRFLDTAKVYADRYINENILKQATDDMGGNPFFLCQFLPDFESLLHLYEITGDKKYLNAAQRGADILKTGIWTQPLFPNDSIVIHKNNKFAGDLPGSFMRRGDGGYRLGYDMDRQSSTFRKQLNPPSEKKVPAWQVSNVGMGFEQADWIFSPSDRRKVNRLIFQTPWTPDFLRLAKHTGDPTYEMYARNAVVGRWGNYPGYYNTGFTDSFFDPKYPVKGPDLSCIYYHHIPVHLGWSIDYLISDAYLLSDGMVDFPFERQYGYAYFDMRVYGHKPGKAFGKENLWLWFKRGLVDISNPQLNYVLTHDEKDIFVIFTNQSQEKQLFEVKFLDDIDTKNMTLYDDGESKRVVAENNSLNLELKGRGITMLKISNPRVSLPEIHHEYETVRNSQHLFREESLTEQIKVKAARIQMVADLSSDYVWIEADFGKVKSVDFYYSNDGEKYSLITDEEYPFEFSSDLTEDGNRFYYYVNVKDNSNKEYISKECLLKK